MLQPINTDFSRSIGTLMGQAQEGIGSIGRVANDYLLKKERQDAIDYQRGRDAKADADLKVQQDRATQLWDQQENARKGTIEQERIANDPNIAKALGVRQNEDLQAKFQANIADHNKVLDSQLQNIVSTNPRAATALQQIQAEGDHKNEMLNSSGQWVPMGQTELAQQNRIDSERAVTSTGLAGGLGIDDYKKGSAAYALAMQPTPSEIAASQAKAKANIIVSTQPILSQMPTSNGTLVKTSEGILAKPAQMTDSEWLLAHPKLSGSLYAKPDVTPKSTTPIDLNGSLLGKPWDAKLGEELGVANPNLLSRLYAGYKEYTNNREKVSTPQGRAAALNDYMTNGKDVTPIKQTTPKATVPTIPAEYQKIAGTPAGKEFLLSAINRIQDPTTRDAILKDFNDKTTDTAGIKPTFTRVGSTYNSKVSSFGGTPINIAGVSNESKTAITDGYKIMEDAINKIGVHQGVTDAAKQLLTGVGQKYGVTQREMGTADILKSSGLDGSLTPKQERMVDSLKGAYDAAVKQYTANQGQDNADRTFGLQVAQLKQQADQHAQTIAMEYAKINASKKNAKEQVSPYSEANQKEAGKLSADSLFNPAARANRVAAEAKNLLPEYQGILTRNSTAARNAREAAEKEIQRQDDIVIAAMKDAQIPK